MSQAFLNTAAITLLGALLAFLSAAYWWGVKHRKEQDARVIELERKISVMEAAVVPISTAMLEMFVKKLTHIHTPEMDALLAKLPHDLSPEEHARLNTLLKERTKDMDPEIDDRERQAAAIMPTLIKMVIEESDIPIAETDVVMVSIPKDAGPK